ncbi:MAG: SDR family NAD(P)-dependent oxidoreductase [Anaerolineales bacterium]|nr:SDR family NAD(P)-dependent oxidoreductase [Anaerolineales bacterium]
MAAGLAERLALVTGTGRGIGQALALALGAAGARVVAVDVNPDGAGRTAAAIQQAGGRAQAEAVDVSNKLAAQTLLYTLLERGERLDLLVNAAHVAPASPALTLDEWEWNRTLEVNLKGVFLMSQSAARAMRQTGGGLILTIQRAAGPPHAAVWAARAGLPGLTEALAAEWAASGVRVELLPALDTAAETAAAVARRARDFFGAHGAPGV